MPLAGRLFRFVAMLPLFAASAALAQTAPDAVARGEYLARAGDCFSCHTKAGGVPLAGGRQVQTPYGTISAPNITPDRETGIGAWSDDDFYRLLHDGIDRAGHYIYPVMPFDHYTKVTRADVLAIKAYLFSQPPVHAPRPPSHLAFPFNIRTSLAAWRALFFKPGTEATVTDRGAYLVEGLGHCGACHTPRNALSGSKQSESLGGGEITGQGWFAPNITSDVHEGIGGWTEQQLVDYLKTGVAPGRAVAAGPMAEAINTSLRHLSDDDLHAIAAYLKATPPQSLFKANALAAPPGANAYLTNCAFCHQPDGRGIEGAVPPLAGNGVVLAGGPQDVIRTILGGLPARGPYAAMPGMGATLSSTDIADISAYIRSSWGNAAPATATPAMVENLAKTTRTMLSGTAACDPVGPPPVAAAIAQLGITPMLQQITMQTMQDQIDAIVARLQSAGGKAPQSDTVNGLTDAYCPIVMNNTALPPHDRLQLLQRFSALTYSAVSAQAK